MENWKESTLGDACDEITYGYTASADVQPVGPRFLRITDIQGGRIDWQQVPFCEVEPKQKARYKLGIGDLVVARTGNSTGENAVIKDDIDAVFASYLIRYRLKKESFDPFFVAYWLRSQSWWDFVAGAKGGSAQAGANAKNLARFSFKYPRLPEQRAIACVLGSLDEKIELNGRQNATLERLAQTLFRAWFVNFEPTKAKSAGLSPACLDEETAALFPDEWEEIGVRKIPKGWKVEALDANIQFLNGLALQKFPPVGDETDLPVIKIAQLRKGTTDANDKANASIAEKYKIQNGDVLFSWSGSLEVVLWNGGAGALNQHLFKVTSPQFPKWFFFFWTLHHLPKFREIAADKATTMGHIQRNHLTEAKICVPPAPLFARMDEIMAPLLAQIENNLQQGRTLAGIRDALLPRLLSGALRVPESLVSMDEPGELMDKSSTSVHQLGLFVHRNGIPMDKLSILMDEE